MNTLVLWNSRGLIPGPEESEENYVLRCRKADTVMEGVPSQTVAEKIVRYSSRLDLYSL